MAQRTPEEIYGVIKPEDSYVEQAKYKLAEYLYKTGAYGNFGGAYKAADSISGIMDFLPGVGDVKGAVEARDAFAQGKNLQGGLLTAGAMLGAIPIAGDLAQKGIRAGTKRLAQNEGDRLADPVLSDIPTVDVNVSAPKAPSGSSRVSTTGQYKGAPAGVNSPEKLEAMRTNLYDLLSEGMIGRNWYDQSSDAGRFLTGDRPGYTQQYALMNAATSQGASVPSNQGFSVKGYNQLITGNQVDTGRFPSAVLRVAEQIPSGQVDMGPKVGPFYEANMVQPGVAASRPTNDLWMARAFDYRTPEGLPWDAGLSEAQHRFMDSEMQRLTDLANEQKLGGFTDWTPEKVQAAIWVSKKSRDEGIPLADAAYDFSYNLDKLTGNINVESEPALGLLHMQNLRESPEAMAALQDAQRMAMSDKYGRDLLSLAAGGLTRPTETGYGYYKNFSAPTDVVRLLAGTETGGAGVDPASRGLLEGIAAAQGLLRGQESVGYNYVRGGVDALSRNAATVNAERVFSPEEMVQIGSKLDDTFGGIAFPVNTANGINILTSGQDDLIDWVKSQGVDIDDWVKYKDVDIKTLPKDVQKKVTQAKGRFTKTWQNKMSQIVQAETGIKPEFGLNSGDLVGSFERYTPSAYLEALEKSGVESAIEPTARELASRLDSVDQQLMQAYPDIGDRSSVLMQVREAISKEGFAGVRKLVQMGIVPVGVVAILYPAIADQLNSEQPRGNGLVEQF